MERVFEYWVLQTVAMALTALLIPRLRITSIFGAIGAVVMLALVNATIWDAALFFRVPDALTSQALVLLAANGLIFWGVAKLLPGIEVEGVLPALAAPIVFTVCSLFVSAYGMQVEWTALFEATLRAIGELKAYLLARA